MKQPQSDGQCQHPEDVTWEEAERSKESGHGGLPRGSGG